MPEPEGVAFRRGESLADRGADRVDVTVHGGVGHFVGDQNFAGFAAIHNYLQRGSGFFFVRTLAEYAGGITQLMKSAHACEAFNANYEIHSYGPTLNLAMYLNVALAIPNCDFAEVMVPQNVLSMGMAAEDLPKVDDRGYIAAPQKAGLGYEIDRDAVENLTLQRF